MIVFSFNYLPLTKKAYFAKCPKFSLNRLTVVNAVSYANVINP